MEIRLIDGFCVVTWKRTSAEVHGEILDKIKRIRGAEFIKDAGCWLVPVAQADRLLAAFPKASYDYDALCAAFDRQDERIGIFGQSLLDMGVRLLVVDGRVIAQGEGVSPLLQSLIDERCAKLAAWLQAQDARYAGKYGQGATKNGDLVLSIQNDNSNENRPSGGDLRQAELLAVSLRNAAQNQY